MTRVLFRVWRAHPRTVIAFLPDVVSNPGRIMSYEHIGQHGEADYYGLLSRTRSAHPIEYNDLLQELQSIGYDDLRVIKRLTRKKGETK